MALHGWHSFIKSVNELLLKLHHVPGTVISSRDTKLNKMKSPCPHGAYSKGNIINKDM